MTAQSARIAGNVSVDETTGGTSIESELPSSSGATRAIDDAAIASSSTQIVDDEDVPKLWSHSMRPSPTYLRLAAASSKPRQKYNTNPFRSISRHLFTFICPHLQSEAIERDASRTQSDQ